MIPAFVAAAGITAVAVFFFLLESEGLVQLHARVRTQLYNTVRWAFVVALTWLLIPAAFSQDSADRPVVVIGMVALAAILILIPVRWFVRMGGRQPAWELRAARLETSRMANRLRRDSESVGPERLDATAERIRLLRTPSTRDLCDLMLAQLADLRAGSESWNEAGRRSIRLAEIGAEMWPEDVPPADFDCDESTFRWRLYRLFGQLLEVGAKPKETAAANEFEKLLASLEEFERPDTHELIACLRTSGREWLKAPSRGPWIEGYDFSPLGEPAAGAIRHLWGRDSALWGARLDEEDLRAIQADLERRRAAEEPPANGTGASSSTPRWLQRSRS